MVSGGKRKTGRKRVRVRKKESVRGRWWRNKESEGKGNEGKEWRENGKENMEMRK